MFRHDRHQFVLPSAPSIKRKSTMFAAKETVSIIIHRPLLLLRSHPPFLAQLLHRADKPEAAKVYLSHHHVGLLSYI
jgi:hypothetical protein